jgi:phage FluMu gp28-like protein
MAQDLGQVIIDKEKDITAHVLRFASGWSISCLSSHPDALVGKTGHIKLDEFAVSKYQRELYRYAKPCTQWGGQLSIISTHRGIETLFNEIITAIKHKGNPMGWSHHRVTIQDAVDQGLVEKINQVSGRNADTPTPPPEIREQFLERTRKECIDEEQWLQEYCCIPADENSAFISYAMISACESPNCMRSVSWLTNPTDSTHLTNCPSFYVGMDVARTNDLCVIDIGEKIGDVLWDRVRLEYRDTMFSDIEADLFPILALPQVKRCCIDASGLGIQLAERAKQRFGYKVEPITFNASIKEEMAFDLRRAFEDRALRIDTDPKLHADLRGIKKLVTSAGNIRFAGESDDSHCDRFWAKALRQHAAKTRKEFFAIIIDDDEPWGRYNWTPANQFFR